MWKFLIDIICLLLMQSKPGQYFLVGFRNGALVITEQVLAHVGLILSKGLCLLNAHSNSVEVWPLWKLTRRKNERLEKWQKMPVLCIDCPLQLDSTGRIIWNNCTKMRPCSNPIWKEWALHTGVSLALPLLQFQASLSPDVTPSKSGGFLWGSPSHLVLKMLQRVM